MIPVQQIILLKVALPSFLRFLLVLISNYFMIFEIGSVNKQKDICSFKRSKSKLVLRIKN